MDAKRHQHTIQGYRNKYSGQLFENIITASCHYYYQQKKALIIKTPEPMKPIKDLGGGKFVAYYEKHAQPDYKGTFSTGQTVIFDAKHTEEDRLKQSAVTPAQTESLNKHYEFGARCFIVVSFGFQQFFNIPWEVFREMKERYGRKYIKPEDIPEYRVQFNGSIVKFLG